MKKFLFKAAAACAVFGLVFCVIGAVSGGELTGIRFGWRDGEPQVEYTHTEMKDLLTGTEPFLEVQTPGENSAGSASGGSTSDTNPNSNSGGNSSGNPDKQLFTGEQIHSLELELGGAQVYLEAADHWGLIVENTTAYTAAVRDGVLKIATREKAAMEPDVVFIITFPRDEPMRQLDIELGGGALENLGDIHCGSLELELGAGSILLQDITVTGECSMDAGMGSIELNGSLARGAEIDCGMGSVMCQLAPVDVYDFEVECGMGSVVLDGSEFAGVGASGSSRTGAAVRYEVECGMGSVEIRHDN